MLDILSWYNKPFVKGIIRIGGALIFGVAAQLNASFLNIADYLYSKGVRYGEDEMVSVILNTIENQKSSI